MEKNIEQALAAFSYDEQRRGNHGMFKNKITISTKRSKVK